MAPRHHRIHRHYPMGGVTPCRRTLFPRRVPLRAQTARRAPWDERCRNAPCLFLRASTTSHRSSLPHPPRGDEVRIQCSHGPAPPLRGAPHGCPPAAAVRRALMTVPPHGWGASACPPLTHCATWDVEVIGSHSHPGVTRSRVVCSQRSPLGRERPVSHRMDARATVPAGAYGEGI